MVKGVASADGRFAFNLDKNVGPGQTNVLEDVQLVQFCFYCLSKDTTATMTPAQRQIYAAVRPGSPFTGLATDPLCVAIRALQQAKGGTQDGIVSALPANIGTSYGRGKHYRMLSYLLASAYMVASENWPRIDKHPVCPSALRAKVKDGCAKLF